MIITIAANFKNPDGGLVTKIQLLEKDVDELEQLSFNERNIVRGISRLDLPGVILDLYRKPINDLRSFSEGRLVGRILVRALGEYDELGTLVPQDLNADYGPDELQYCIGEVEITKIPIARARSEIQSVFKKHFLDTAQIYRNFYKDK